MKSDHNSKIEAVRIIPAGNAAAASGKRPDAVRHGTQHLISIVPSVELIYQVELVDVHHHSVNFLPRVELVVLIGILEEIILGKKARKLIFSCGIDDVSVDGQLNGAPYPCSYNLWPVIGFPLGI